MISFKLLFLLWMSQTRFTVRKVKFLPNQKLNSSNVEPKILKDLQKIENERLFPYKSLKFHSVQKVQKDIKKN